MNSRSLILEHEKKIDVYDGLFPMEFRSYAYQFCRNSLFRIGWSDSPEPEKQAKDYFFHSKYSPQDLDNLGIMKYIEKTPIMDRLKDLELTHCIVNCSTPSDVNYIHIHQQKVVLLYYINMDWQDGWHGETQFYSENKQEVQFTSPYTPGRLIAFDANIPHAIRPQSSIGPSHRFTLAIIYDKKLDKD